MTTLEDLRLERPCSVEPCDVDTTTCLWMGAVRFVLAVPRRWTGNEIWRSPNPLLKLHGRNVDHVPGGAACGV
jgi:hypothetical protein